MGHDLIDGNAHRPFDGKAFCMGATTGYQLKAKTGNVFAGGIDRFSSEAKGFAQRRKVTHLDLHDNHPENGQKLTTSPWTMV